MVAGLHIANIACNCKDVDFLDAFVEASILFFFSGGSIFSVNAARC